MNSCKMTIDGEPGLYLNASDVLDLTPVLMGQIMALQAMEPMNPVTARYIERLQGILTLCEKVNQR